ncbi:MAG: ferredoxin [Bacteroidales bacterium]
MSPETKIPEISRREFFRKGMQWTILLGIGGITVGLISKTMAGKTVWQIDTKKCTQCGRCALNCIKKPSAVKCFHGYDLCGYCDLCGGYFKPGTKNLTTAAENQLCPTAAIQRKFIEEPFFEYDIDKALCIGCGKCVKGCGAFGNGSLQLQIDHSLCDNCNECSIARDCPSNAISRVNSKKAYLMQGLKAHNEWKNKL